jgi:trk system potassium uptake protein
MNIGVRRARLSPPRTLVLGFAIIIIIGAFLLSLPISSADLQPMPLMDAFFTATSATCVTGLVVVDTAAQFSMFGQVVIMVLIQIGGLGFMTMAALISIALRRRISLKDRLILQEAMKQNSMEGIVRLIRKVLLYSFTIQAVGAALLTMRWAFDMPFGRAVYFGIFHSISYFNNAGFDLFGNFRSLTQYSEDWVVNTTVMTLIVLGGLGFIVLSDLFGLRETMRLSLHSKVVLSTTGFLIAVGAVVFFVFEFTNARTFGSLGWSGKLLASLFQSVTPRSGGAATVDISSMRQASQFFMIILMFIGASPGSNGGGIKTTTFATLVGAVFAMFRGKQDVVLFKYRLEKDRVYKAITMTLFAMFLVAFVTMLLSTTEDHHFLMILFEVTSAFGTVGASMGLTPDLTPFGKISIMFMMFIGRLGPLTLAYALGPKNEKELYRYPEGKIILG